MEPQWTPVFETLLREVQSATRSDSREFVYSVIREIEAHKVAIHATLEVPAPNASHRAQLKLGASIC
jgi:hypothetical protein